MNASTSERRSALLVPLLQRWQGLLQRCYPSAPAIVRISSGAALITRARAARIDNVVGQLLGLSLPYLFRADLSVPESMIRAKLLVEIRRPCAGLLLRLRYYGDPPTLDHGAWVRGELRHTAVLLDSASCGQVITLGALLAEPQRNLSVIHVRAGGQRLALPMAAVAKAVPSLEEQPQNNPQSPISLAECLGLTESESITRPAWLLVKTPAQAQPLRVDALEGHGQAAVMAPGPLFLALPWCLGFIYVEDQLPIQVIDPWLLLQHSRQSQQVITEY